MRISKPTPSMAVAVAALVIATGGTSYAASQISSDDVKNNSLSSRDIKNNSLLGKDIKDSTITTNDVLNGSLLRSDFRAGQLVSGAKGARGPTGLTGPTGPAGAGRWVLVGLDGTIEDSSGGFTVSSHYDTFDIGGGANPPAGAVGNVYINANEDLTNNGVVASIALQNQIDQNGDGIMNGRALVADADPEFSGEISATQCAVANPAAPPANLVGCAPAGTNNTNHFVVSPRMSDGQVTTSTTRKRFYVIITGDSTDRTP